MCEKQNWIESEKTQRKKQIALFSGIIKNHLGESEQTRENNSLREREIHSEYLRIGIIETYENTFMLFSQLPSSITVFLEREIYL